MDKKPLQKEGKNLVSLKLSITILWLDDYEDDDHHHIIIIMCTLTLALGTKKTPGYGWCILFI